MGNLTCPLTDKLIEIARSQRPKPTDYTQKDFHNQPLEEWVKSREDNSVPYRPVRPELTVPASQTVQKHY